MLNLFKKKKPRQEFFRNIPLCTVKINTGQDFKLFADYAYANRMYRNYAISELDMWKSETPIVDCFAIVNYAPNAGMGHKIRVDFVVWGPLTAKRLGDIFEKTTRNYETVSPFIEQFASDTIYSLLSRLHPCDSAWNKI